MKTLRTFIAIEPPEKIKRHIGSIITKLKKKGYPIVWISPDKAHITLHFLGNIGQSRMEMAAKITEEVSKIFQNFTLTTGSVAYFYTERLSRHSVVFLDVIDRDKKLRKLYNVLRNNLKNAGFHPPNRIYPHITLGRLKKQRRKHTSRRILSELSETDLNFIPFKVETLSIFESVGNGEKRYHLLKRFKFGG